MAEAGTAEKLNHFKPTINPHGLDELMAAERMPSTRSETPEVYMKVQRCCMRRGSVGADAEVLQLTCTRAVS